MKRSAASSTARSVVGAAIGGFVFFAVGCPVSLVVGWQIAFHENDGGSETLYSISNPTPEHAVFWVVLYDDLDNTTLWQIHGPDGEAPSGQNLIPSNETDATLGPWRGPGPPTYLNSTIPSGEHNYHAGGVAFTQIGETTRAELVLYPRGRRNGWIREYYIYDIRDSQATLNQSKRERSFNKWGIEILVKSAFLMTAAATVLGTLAGFAFGPRAFKNHIRL